MAAKSLLAYILLKFWVNGLIFFLRARNNCDSVMVKKEWKGEWQRDREGRRSKTIRERALFRERRGERIKDVAEVNNAFTNKKM